MKDLLGWLKRTDAHPLIAGCVFHYELEFIHPFADGNGRIGRLWQTLILSQWNSLFAFLPVETVIRDQQAEYYKVLAACDKAGNSTAFIEFLPAALLTALREAAGTDQVGDQVTDQVAALLRVPGHETLTALECIKRLKFPAPSEGSLVTPSLLSF
jgi:Fic family protein